MAAMFKASLVAFSDTIMGALRHLDISSSDASHLPSRLLRKS